MKVYRSVVIDGSDAEDPDHITTYHKSLAPAVDAVRLAARDGDGKRINSMSGHVDCIEFAGKPAEIILTCLNRGEHRAAVERKWQLDGEVEKPVSRVKL